MKNIFLAALLVICSSGAFAQADTNDSANTEDDTLIKRRLLVHDFENQVKSIHVSAVRVLTRYSVASWLLKEGDDKTGRAEGLLHDAAEDMIKNRNEIPTVYASSLWSNLISLLERHRPEAAGRIRNRYEATFPEARGAAHPPRSAAEEKPAVDRSIRAIHENRSIDLSVVNLMDELRQRRSSEFSRLAEAVMIAEETGRVRSSSSMYILLLASFTEPAVSRSFEQRFLRVVVNRATEAGQAVSAEVGGFFDLLGRVLPIISEKHPGLSPEAAIANAVLSSRISRETRDERERNERISNSADKLAAVIREAEEADDSTVKFELYRRAARMALDAKYFIKAVDLMRLSGEIDMSLNSIPEALRQNERNHFFKLVVERSLEHNDPDSSVYSIKALSDPVLKVEGLTLKSRYFYEKGDRLAAMADLDGAIGMSSNIEDISRRASVLLKMLSLAQGIDAGRMYEINRLAASSINKISLPTSARNDDAEAHREYVSQIMVVNWNLLPALSAFAKADQNGAADLAGRIEKKEVRIIADFVVARQTLDQPSANVEKTNLASTERLPLVR